MVIAWCKESPHLFKTDQVWWSTLGRFIYRQQSECLFSTTSVSWLWGSIYSSPTGEQERKVSQQLHSLFSFLKHCAWILVSNSNFLFLCCVSQCRHFSVIHYKVMAFLEYFGQILWFVLKSQYKAISIAFSRDYFCERKKYKYKTVPSFFVTCV